MTSAIAGLTGLAALVVSAAVPESADTVRAVLQWSGGVSLGLGAVGYIVSPKKPAGDHTIASCGCYVSPELRAYLCEQNRESTS